MTNPRYTPDTDDDFSSNVESCNSILESAYPTDPAGIAARRKLTALVSEDAEVMEALSPSALRSVLTDLAKYEGSDNGRMSSPFWSQHPTSTTR
jgi:hypothetical protein